MGNYDVYGYIAIGLALLTAAAFLVKFKGVVAVLGALGFTLPLLAALAVLTGVEPGESNETVFRVMQITQVVAGLCVVLALFLVTPARLRGGRVEAGAPLPAGATAAAPGFGLPVALLVLAGALPLLEKPIRETLLGKAPGTGGGALAYADFLDHQNEAAKVAGGIAITAAALALLGIVMLIHVLVRRRRARA